MKKGQSVIEFAVLIAVVAIAFMAMNAYTQRSFQAMFKTVEDRVNAGP
jgi:Flp pilus assembly pilin Flp